MEKKQKKEYIQIITLSLLIAIFSISTIFNTKISITIKNLLDKGGVYASQESMIVHFIDAGQGDAIAIKFPNDEIMLIDSGPKYNQNYIVNYIKSKVISSNDNLNIDYVLLTHPELDHLGGMSAIFSEFNVKNFYRPNIASESEDENDFASISTLDEYNSVIQLAGEEKDIQIQTINKSYKFYVDKVKVEIFSPLYKYSTYNSMSPIVKISYLGKSFLFTGDIMYDAEYDMIEHYGDLLDADVLKVAHHGSYTSTTEAFVKEVTPDYSVICVGDNSYGHPHIQTIVTLQNNNSKVLTTQNGAIVFACEKGSIKLLGNDDVWSSEFVEWWVIAVVINILLLIILVKIVIKVVRSKKLDKLSMNTQTYQ